MSIEDTKLHARSVGSELNLYSFGWKFLLDICQTVSDTQEPRFVLGWHKDEPVVPEILDEWELSEIDRQRYR